MRTTYGEGFVKYFCVRSQALRKGGADALDNMLPACRSCNHYKGSLTVEKATSKIRTV